MAQLHILLKTELAGLRSQWERFKSDQELEKGCKCPNGYNVERHVCDECAFFDCGRRCECECREVELSLDHLDGCEVGALKDWYERRIQRLMHILKDAPIEALTEESAA